MKKTFVIVILALVAFLVLDACKKSPKPISERVKKVWVPRIVKENNTVVYSNGGSSNIKPAYSAYKLNLSSAPTATITEVDGQTYTGTYSVQNDNKIVISGIQPEPTGSGGVLEYTITSLAEDNTELVLTLVGAYPKTGNTTNQYTLVGGQ